MMGNIVTVTRRKTLKQHVQRFIHKRIWKMDIHPSAWIASTALIDRTWPKGVHIEENVVIDEEVVMLAHDMTRGIYMDTRLGAGTYVGPRAIILPGVSVGKNCVIRPGAFVNRDVPDGVTVTGNPAMVEGGIAVPPHD